MTRFFLLIFHFIALKLFSLHSQLEFPVNPQTCSKTAYFDHNQQFEQIAEKKSRVKILIRSRWSGGGEKDMVVRLKIAASNLGWEAEEDFFEPNHESTIPKGLDFIINLTPGFIPPQSGTKNYAVFAHPYPPPVLDDQGYLLERYFKFDGFLFTLQNLKPIENQFKHLGKVLHYIYWYPTINDFPYKQVSPQKLTFIISHWGDRATDKRYRKLYSFLDQSCYCIFYSIDERNRKYYPNSYHGKIPYDGISLVNTLSNGGINLVLHSDIHNNAGIPSGRIFEAAAASCVIISDLNEFVIKHFGDTVLYFDHTLDSLSMFKQIDDHMKWIISHPEEALIKAKKAHEIFQENFILEEQLLNLKKLHETVSMMEEKES